VRSSGSLVDSPRFNADRGSSLGVL